MTFVSHSVMRPLHLSYLADVELLRELIQNRGVAVLVFLNDRDDKSDQFVPKVHTVQSGTVVFWISFGLSRFRLNREGSNK